MFDWVLNMSLHPSSQENRKTEKKLGELRNEFLQMFGETLLNKLLLLPQKLFI